MPIYPVCKLNYLRLFRNMGVIRNSAISSILHKCRRDHELLTISALVETVENSVEIQQRDQYFIQNNLTLTLGKFWTFLEHGFFSIRRHILGRSIPSMFRFLTSDSIFNNLANK